MFKNLLILLLSTFLLFSCSKKDKQEVISKASDEEINLNIRARSAKLRYAKKTSTEPNNFKLDELIGMKFNVFTKDIS